MSEPRLGPSEREELLEKIARLTQERDEARAAFVCFYESLEVAIEEIEEGQLERLRDEFVPEARRDLRSYEGLHLRHLRVCQRKREIAMREVREKLERLRKEANGE